MEREPNFQNLLTVLAGEEPERPTLFEFFMNDRIYSRFAGPAANARTDRLAPFVQWIEAFRALGYDYATVAAWHLNALSFPTGEKARQSTISLNEGFVITDRASLEAYPWMDPAAGDYSPLAELAEELPAGMKLIVSGPGGVLENAIALVGYENLCYLIADDPELVGDVFEAVGSRLERYYRLACAYDTVGAAISNDDWGFKTQTMLSPDDMRRFVFPWHRRIVAAIHEAGKPAILHSCGNPEAIIDDLIDDMGYDGRHSYEDAVVPVEEAYERWGDRVAILGGIDVDFLVRATPEKIHDRSRAMLERSAGRGGYALGTGNSVPQYIPDEKYLAMLRAATGLEYV